MINVPNINSIFPTPVYINSFSRPFNKEEIDFVNEQKNFTVKNTGNITTADNYILNKGELSNIKKELDLICQDYLKKIINPSNDIELYITQSWLNYTEENEFHHIHEHPNSYISGVLYFNADEKNDKIKFHDKKYKLIKPDIKNYNIWNSESWFFTVKTGDVVLFPSSTTHQVDSKQGTNTRISLAFNTFFKGTIGSNKFLTELIL